MDRIIYNFTFENVEQTNIDKDSLENSINMVNCLSLNDSINVCHPTIEGLDEYSIEEKKKMNRNLKDLGKSFQLKTSTSQINFNATNATSCVNSKNDCEETAKISYKFISKYDRQAAEGKLSEVTKNIKKEIGNARERFCWFAAYDKYTKTKNLKKILNFYSEFQTESPFLKEQPIIMKDFEIYYETNFAFPFIRAKKDGFAFLKLYYLSIDDLNKIFNYINKTDQNLIEETFNIVCNLGDHMNLVKMKQSFNFSSLSTSLNNHIHPFSELMCLGSFLNTNIYTFTNYYSVNIKEKGIRTLNNKKEDASFIKSKTKSISKIIKYLTTNFPNYSEEFFIYHIYSKTNSDKLIEGRINISLTEIKAQLVKKKANSNLRPDKKNNSKLSIKNSQNKVTMNTSKNLCIKQNTSSKQTPIKDSTSSFKKINTKTVDSKKILKSFSIHGLTTTNKQLSKLMTETTSTKADNKKTIDTNLISNFSDININNNLNISELSLEIDENNNKTTYNYNNVKINNNFTTPTNNIYVVSRDDHIRHRTEFNVNESLDSIEDSDSAISIQQNAQTNPENMNTIEDMCYNTPIKKKLLRYYS